ncbi:MAG TPA: hypothetical protein VNI61_00890 [Gemmatimonadales bacterium]|nr:hypothetical protein [Gemmatimonadales bacterium]
MGLGGGTITLTLVAVRALQYLDLARYGEPVADLSLDLIAGLGAGIVVAAFFGWRRSRPLDNVWQQGVIAVLAPVGALLIAFILAVPAEHFLHLPGLVGLTVASVAFGIMGSRWAVKGAGGEAQAPGSEGSGP